MKTDCKILFYVVIDAGSSLVGIHISLSIYIDIYLFILFVCKLCWLKSSTLLLAFK